jgi:hypothetical protein
MTSLIEIEPTFPSSKPASVYICLDIRHEDDYDHDAISVDVDAALVGGKAKFVLGYIV